MHNLQNIKENDYLKYFKNLFKIKSVEKLNSGGLLITYYFRSIEKDNAKLYKNGVYEIRSGYLTEKLKRASPKEINFLLSRIKNYNSENGELYKGNLSNVKNEERLNENDCIEFLKSKGYLIYKQQ